MVPARRDDAPWLTDEAIVAAFDRALVEYAPAVRERLINPGLSDSQITAQFETIGVRPSDEALVWWRYFDKPNQTGVDFPLHVLPDFEFVSVSQSVAAFRFLRRLAEENTEPGRDPDTACATQWIPLFGMGTGGFVALDCRGPADGPSPVRSVRPDTAYGPDHAPVTAPSLGELLAGATRWMQQGTCRFEPERGLWWPLDAWIDESDAERYARPQAEG
jgi:hypothetical protein